MAMKREGKGLRIFIDEPSFRCYQHISQDVSVLVNNYDAPVMIEQVEHEIVKNRIQTRFSDINKEHERIARDQFYERCEKHVSNIINKGFDVLWKTERYHEESELSNKPDSVLGIYFNYTLTYTFYTLKEDEYAIIFADGVNDETLDRACLLAKQNINVEIEKIFSKKM